MMARLPKDRPANTQLILQRLRELDRGLEQSRQQTEVSGLPLSPSAPLSSDPAKPGSLSQPPPLPATGGIPPTDIQPPHYDSPPAYVQPLQSTPVSSTPPSPPAGVPPTDLQPPAYTHPHNSSNVTPPSNQELAEAKQQIKAAWIAGIVSTVITLIATLALSGSDAGSFLWIDVFLSAGFTFGIYKKVRACAVSMLAYFILSKVLQISAAVQTDAGINPIAIGFGCLFIYFYTQGVRGTYTYHRLTNTPPH